MNRLALIVGIVICLFAAAERLYSLLVVPRPLAQVGECVDFYNDSSFYFCKILENKKKIAILDCMMVTNQGVYQEVQEFEHKELKDLGATKVGCK
jgi:hypothetical protein